MKFKLILIINLFLLIPLHNSYANVLYKNLAAPSMFQPGITSPEFVQAKFEKEITEIENLEREMNNAKGKNEELFERDEELVKVLSRVDSIDIESLDPRLKKLFFILKLKLLRDLGLYSTCNKMFDAAKDKLNLTEADLPGEINQKKQEFLSDPETYIAQMRVRFDLLFLVRETLESNIDLNIMMHRYFVFEWLYLLEKIDSKKIKSKNECRFIAGVQIVYLIKMAFVKRDNALLENISEIIFKNELMPMFSKNVLISLLKILKEDNFDFNKMRILAALWNFDFSLEQRREGLLYLDMLFKVLPKEDNLRKDFLSFSSDLSRDWQDAFPYEYVYTNISCFLRQKPYCKPNLVYDTKNVLETSLSDVVNKDNYEYKFLVSLLIAIKSKDINKYKLALDSLKELLDPIEKKQYIEFSDFYVNLFVSTWNIYKVQPMFNVSPIGAEVDFICERLIEKFYLQDMQIIAEFWKNFNATTDQRIIPVTAFEASEGRDVSIISDTHGEINAIIFPLVSRGLIQLTGRVILWDLKIRQEVPANQMSTTCVFLPEVVVLPESKQEILQFLGDFIDKGKFTDESIAFLDYLFKKDSRLLNNIHIVLGNHEFNLLKSGRSGNSTYNNRNFLLIRNIFVDWIRQNIMQYSFVENGWLYSHSFVSINFLKRLYFVLDNYKKDIDPTLVNQAKETINWFLNGKAEETFSGEIDIALYERSGLDFNSEEYKRNLFVLNEILNKIFLFRMESMVKDSFNTTPRSILFDLISPVWSRLNHVSQEDGFKMVPCPNIKNGYGHTPFSFVFFGGRPLMVKRASGGDFLYKHSVDYDCAMSYGLRLLNDKSKFFFHNVNII